MFWPTVLVALQLAADGRTDDFVLGYMTGSQRRPGDISYSKPGRTISGAISLAVEEINAGPFKEKGKFPLLLRLTSLTPSFTFFLDLVRPKEDFKSCPNEGGKHGFIFFIHHTLSHVPVATGIFKHNIDLFCPCFEYAGTLLVEALK